LHNTQSEIKLNFDYKTILKTILKTKKLYASKKLIDIYKL